LVESVLLVESTVKPVPALSVGARPGPANNARRSIPARTARPGGRAPQRLTLRDGLIAEMKGCANRAVALKYVATA